ncbi:MAG TPA: TolC family protein [Candidatus Binatia bacterium]|jgi:outer membrane protein TolC
MAPRPAFRTTLVLLLAVGAGCHHIAPRPLAPEWSASALEARRLDDPGLRVFLASVPNGVPEAWPLRRWDLDRLTLAALYFHPALDVARAHAAAVAAGRETAAMRPNPTLGVSPQLSTNPMGAVSPWLTMVSIDWQIETAGKRGDRMARAEADAAATREAAMAAAWSVRHELASAVVALAALDRQDEWLAAEVAGEERLVALLESRLREGAASAADAAPVRLALLEAERERADTRARGAEAIARVAAAVGVPADALAGIALPSGLDAAQEEALTRVAAPAARRRAMLERADVRQGVAEYAASEAALKLELARQYPDVRLGPTYQFDQGQNEWGVALTVDLPLLNRNDGPIAEAAAARDEMAARFLATQAGALAEVEQVLARRDGALVRRQTVGNLARDRTRNLERTRRALALGAVDRVAELGAEVEHLRAERAAVDGESAVGQACVDLEAALQGPLGGAALERPRGVDVAGGPAEGGGQ